MTDTQKPSERSLDNVTPPPNTSVETPIQPAPRSAEEAAEWRRAMESMTVGSHHDGPKDKFSIVDGNEKQSVNLDKHNEGDAPNIFRTPEHQSKGNRVGNENDP